MDTHSQVIRAKDALTFKTYKGRSSVCGSRHHRSLPLPSHLGDIESNKLPQWRVRTGGPAQSTYNTAKEDWQRLLTGEEGKLPKGRQFWWISRTHHRLCTSLILERKLPTACTEDSNSQHPSLHRTLTFVLLHSTDFADLVLFTPSPSGF